MSLSVQNWESDAKGKDKDLRKMMESLDPLQLPPIRQSPGCNQKKPINQMDNSKPSRIRSCDYQQWDKYDAGKNKNYYKKIRKIETLFCADTEILKMDLNMEKVREEVAEKNRKNEQKPLVEVLDEPDFCKGLTFVERTALADQ